MTEIWVTPVWILYCGKPLISNEIFVLKDAILPKPKGNAAIITGLSGEKKFSAEELSPLDLSIQGEKLPKNLLLATKNLKKHLEVLKETGRARFKFHLDGSLSVSVEESLRLVG